jgi:hypothetical protein
MSRRQRNGTISVRKQQERELAIIRGAVECETCGQPHTVRVGMGQDETQEHRFPCRQCKEDIVIHLDVDYQNVAAHIRCGSNSKPIDEVTGAPIVNLDANFLFSEAEQGQDGIFPRLRQMREIVKRIAEQGKSKIVDPRELSEAQLNSRPYRRPDYLAEWKRLKRAWSLARNDKDELSQRIIDAAHADFYSADDALDGLSDWLWRFSMFASQPAYEPKFRDALTAIENADQSRLPGLGQRCEHEMVRQRADLYFAAFNEFFSGYGEYAQVFFSITRGDVLAADKKATSYGFKSVKLSYGNLFESFTSLIEFLVLLNNILQGRDHDKFAQLTLDNYRRLDKSGRCNPLRSNPALFALCEEADNQLRNASHHGGIKFDSGTQTILYRAGKGGSGDEQSMAYADYLSRCVRLFLQILTLLRIELALCNHFRWSFPIK